MDVQQVRQRRLSVELKYALISILVIGVFVLLQVFDLLRGVNDTVADGVDRLARLGSIGVFVIALIANASIIVQIPYTLPLLSAALGGATLTSMEILGFASGVGAAIGAILGYKVADTVVVKSHAQPAGRLFGWISDNVDTKPRLTSFVIFLVALSPLPDGTVLVPLAVVRYPMRRLVVPLFLGKFLHSMRGRAALLPLRIVGGGQRVGAGEHESRPRGRGDLHAARRLPRREGADRRRQGPECGGHRLSSDTISLAHCEPGYPARGRSLPPSYARSSLRSSDTIRSLTASRDTRLAAVRSRAPTLVPRFGAPSVAITGADAPRIGAHGIIAHDERPGGRAAPDQGGGARPPERRLGRHDPLLPEASAAPGAATRGPDRLVRQGARRAARRASRTSSGRVSRSR